MSSKPEFNNNNFEIHFYFWKEFLFLIMKIVNTNIEENLKNTNNFILLETFIVNILKSNTKLYFSFKIFLNK